MNKKKKHTIFRYMNKWILLLSIIFVISGAFFILDASTITSTLEYSTPYYFFLKQLVFIAIGFICSFIVLKIPTKLYELLSFLGSIILIIASLIILGSNIIISGVNTVTLNILGISIQPAEFFKIFIVVFMGSFYGKWSNYKRKNLLFLFPLLLCSVSLLITLGGGDFGSAAIMAALYALIFISVPKRKNTENVNDKKINNFMNYTKAFAVFGLIFCIIFLKFGYLVIPDEKLNENYRLNRFVYKNPCSRYEEKSGYQVCNGYIAIDNGGLLGKGPGSSSQKYLYLPASHTDFIFPIIIEEFGVLMGVVIILLYMVLTYFIFKVATNTYELSNSIICYGIGIYFLLHIFVNLGGVLGIIPITGIPLPFLSSGGSYCIALMIALAIVQRINIENNIQKKNKEINNIVNY